MLQPFSAKILYDRTFDDLRVMTSTRPDPDALIAQLREQDGKAVRGRLRIYFGSSPGVGKTYAMLQAAQKLKSEGVDVLAGVVVTHGRRETLALLEGIDQLPLRSIDYRDKKLLEFDLDAALDRRPKLILIDELAHSNVAGSRHPKRWQDVDELLGKGINVYSTLNVQHLDSLNDVVGGITGVRVQETLPDTFFDAATEIVMVDTPADELLARLKAGKVYVGPQAERAAHNFFRKGNLMALRELALRRTADRVEGDILAWRSVENIASVWKNEAAILCAIGPTPAAESVVRSAAQLAQQLNVSWHAVYVETPMLLRLPDAQRERILRVVRLARDLGASTGVLPGQEPARVLIDYARAYNLSKLVFGRSSLQGGGWRRLWRQIRALRSLQFRLTEGAPELDLIAVAAMPVAAPLRESVAAVAVDREPGQRSSWRRYGAAAGVCALIAALSWPMQWHFDQANIVMLFLLAVVGVAVKLGRGPAVFASFLSVALFDFFFVEPKLSFAVSDVQYLLTFGVMLAVGLISGQLTAGLRYQAQVAAERQSRSRALFELTSQLASGLEGEHIVSIAEDVLAREVAGAAFLFTVDLHNQLRPSPRQVGVAGADLPDLGTARWALEQRTVAGLATDTLPGSAWFYLPLASPLRVRGVLALRPQSSRSVLLPELRARRWRSCLDWHKRLRPTAHYQSLPRN